MSNKIEDGKAISADAAMDIYWQAANDGKLLLKKCADCKETYYYPRPICPFCMSSNTDWVAASGKGKIYSWSVQHKPEPAFAIAFVTLEEGPTILTNIVDTDFDNIRIDQQVNLKFETREEKPVPVFSAV